MKTEKYRVLIPFHTMSLYGMERAVIETFDLLRPQVEPHFVMSVTARQMNLPVFDEIKRRRLSFSFLSDPHGWPRIERPRSLKDAWRMSVAMVRGNLDVLKASRDQDILYLPGIQYFYFAILAALVLRLRRKRVVYHFHDLITRRSLRLHLTSLFVTDFVHNTQLGRDEVASANSYLLKKKNWIIPCTMTQKDSVNGKHEFVFEAGQQLLFVGQVARHKGVDLLLDAMTLLGQSHADLTLNIVGGCAEPELETRIKTASNGDKPRIKYWGYQDSVLGMMRAADIYVQPSVPSRFKESFGRSVMEAMSVGTPTVCFKSGALQELVINEQTGVVCEEESAECLAAGIERLLVNNDLRLRCGGSALRRYVENYSNLKVKALWLECFTRSNENCSSHV